MSLREILAVPQIFQLFNALIGANASRERFAGKFVRAQKGDKLFDIGCGLAEISTHLRHTDYYGFDISAAYIAKARQMHGNTITLFNEEFSSLHAERLGPFDVGIGIGLMHHLSDQQLTGLLHVVKQALRPGGRFVTIDGCYDPAQSPAARYLLSKDRGHYVRSKEGYEKIIRSTFEEYTLEICHDMLRIPYTHIIFECRKRL